MESYTEISHRIITKVDLVSDKIIYSTESGDLRQKQKSDSRSQPGIKKDGIIRVQRESKGRGGKTVSVIYGLPLSGKEISDLAGRLKRGCGTGGTVKDNAIIIQGDKIDFLIQFLQNEGFTVKRSGGS
jgi:translation initiation factor 1